MTCSARSKPTAAIVLVVCQLDLTHPVLTIVTPVLDAAEFLPSALRSVREAAEGGASIEHIIVDGGSTDGSLEIARCEQARHGSPIVEILTGPDGGQAEALNRGFALARGKYLGWINADDVYLPGGLLWMTRRLELSVADVVIGRCRFVDLSGKIVFQPIPPDPVSPVALVSLLSGWYAGRSIVQPEAFFTREAFVESGGLDARLHYTMDHEFWLRLAMRGAGFEDADEVVAHQLVHPGQKTADNAAVVAEQLVYCMQYLKERPSIFGDQIKQVRDEIQTLASKLETAQKVICQLKRIGDGRGYEPPVAMDIDSRVIRRLAKVAKRPQAVLCSGLTSGEIREVVQQLQPAVPPVVTNTIPSVDRAFDVAVVRYSGRSDGWEDRLAALLREGGLVAILGAPDSPNCQTALGTLQREISNRVTWNQTGVVSNGGDQNLIKLLSRCQAVCTGNFVMKQLCSIYSESYGYEDDHPLCHIAKLVGYSEGFQPWRSGIWCLDCTIRT